MCAKSRQSCVTLCNAMDCSPTGSSVQGISQARTLEWVAIFFSKGLFIYLAMSGLSYHTQSLCCVMLCMDSNAGLRA